MPLRLRVYVDVDGYGAVHPRFENRPLPDASVTLMAMVLCGSLRPLIKLKHVRDWTAAYCVCCDAEGYGAVRLAATAELVDRGRMMRGRDVNFC